MEITVEVLLFIEGKKASGEFIPLAFRLLLYWLFIISFKTSSATAFGPSGFV